MTETCGNCKYWEWNATQSSVKPQIGRCLYDPNINFYVEHFPFIHTKGKLDRCENWIKADSNNGGDE